jgi:hypothetical protein
MQMSKSIISNERYCLVCGSPNICKHHIYGGVGRRKLSEKYGCWCFLCPRHHNMSNEGVHFNKTLDLKLKQQCQKAFEWKHTREEFMNIFGKSYIMEEK